MNRKLLLVSVALAAVVSCGLIRYPAFGQKKTTGKTAKEEPKLTASSIPEPEMEVYRQQATQLVKFLESTLNFLGDKTNSVKEKEIIINDSFQKFFWDDKVQIEDDLDMKRLVPLYKDVQAYLTDVDFFFKGARFDYQVQDVNVQSNHAGQSFFKVTANRSLKGLTLDGDSVSSNQVRYIEINYDDNKKQIKIVSIYTTKLNEKEDLRNWWNGLSQGWREIFGSSLQVEPGLMLSQVEHYNDTVALVDSLPVPIPDSRLYGLFLKVVDSRMIDLSGNAMVSDLEPLARLSSLTTLNLSGTPVADLMPLRNLNALENLDISGTPVNSLDPLKYCNHIRELNLSHTSLTDISILASYPLLEVLDISHTPISDLRPLSELTRLRVLRINNSRVSDLAPLAGLKQLTELDFSSTPVSSMEALANMAALQTVRLSDTKISALDALGSSNTLNRIYCDHTQVRKDQAVQFMIDHPGVVVSFATESLQAWWNALSPEWQKVFFIYRKIDISPTPEQLHLLMTIDSLNINGRSAITSLSPLTELPRLRWLDCSLTGVTGLDPLINLLNIGHLNVRSTGVASVEPLSSMARLSRLNLDDTKVSDLSPLVRLPALELILADNSEVTKEEAIDFMERNPRCLVISQTYENTTWWKNLPDAWKEVFRTTVGFSQEPDRFQLQQIANLKQLSINGIAAITDIQPIVYLTRLEEFRFTDTRVASLQPVSRMTWLKRLGFPKNAIADLSPLTGLTGLVELDAENTQVEDLRPIEGLVHLEVLKISGTPVKNLKELGGMRKLEVFDCYNTKVSNIDVLNNMRNLQSVKIFNTRISDKRVEKFKAAHPGCEVVYY